MGESYVIFNVFVNGGQEAIQKTYSGDYSTAMDKARSEYPDAKIMAIYQCSNGWTGD